MSVMLWPTPPAPSLKEANKRHPKKYVKINLTSIYSFQFIFFISIPELPAWACPLETASHLAPRVVSLPLFIIIDNISFPGEEPRRAPPVPGQPRGSPSGTEPAATPHR